jgi:metallo-beta-lactamase class B
VLGIGLALLGSLSAALYGVPAGAQAPARSTPPAAGAATAAQTNPSQADTAQKKVSGSEDWNVPFAPFHIIGNIHYVGASGVSSYLITTPAGAILLDGGLPETAPLIMKSIAELGFRVQDVKFLLNSHAHYDHAGGLAALKKASGAKLVASSADAKILRAGAPQQPAVAVDRVLKNGEGVELGGTRLTAHVTPGHTPGCTTWTMTTTSAGKSHDVVFYCSTTVVDRLVGNVDYPSIVSDYERSFPALRALTADVFLAPHPMQFQMAAKRERMSDGAPNPFVDPSELRRYVDQSEQEFRAALARHQREAASASEPSTSR